MAKKKTYDFKEKQMEFSSKQGKQIPVWASPKYEQSKAKAIQVIEKYDDIHEGDFWILMNESKSGKMIYSGLIISHNACLKINDAAKDEDKFRPDCVTINENGYGGALVFTYNCPDQGIFEVGEVTPKNCKNDYPYAMALKRCMDRVILKISKIAFEGIYSDSEADEFKEPMDAAVPAQKAAPAPNQPMAQGAQDYLGQIRKLAAEKNVRESTICAMGAVKELEDMYEGQMVECINWLISEEVHVEPL